jgi:hypothetical protein
MFALRLVEIEIAGSRIMLADEYPEIDFLSPAARGGTTVTIHLYVPDADKVMQRATEAGGTLVQPMIAQSARCPPAECLDGALSGYLPMCSDQRFDSCHSCDH